MFSGIERNIAQLNARSPGSETELNFQTQLMKSALVQCFKIDLPSHEMRVILEFSLCRLIWHFDVPYFSIFWGEEKYHHLVRGFAGFPR
jgi:hypothetical protein